MEFPSLLHNLSGSHMRERGGEGWHMRGRGEESSSKELPQSTCVKLSSKGAFI
jgi:hypothetical protein